MTFFPSAPSPWDEAAGAGERGPVKVSRRTLRLAIEETLIHSFTERNLQIVLAEELDLVWEGDESGPSNAATKRQLVDGYIDTWNLSELVGFARRLVADVEILDGYGSELLRYIDAYERGGGVEGPTKNLIFAANGPKPDIVLRDAVSNDIEVVANAAYCLVYDRPVQGEGLRYSHLIQWWREHEGIAEETDDRTVGLRLHDRLRESLDSPAEEVVFDAYAARYKSSGFDIPALVPQVYLHYDPYDQRTRRGRTGSTPLERQRMDFLLLFDNSRRVVVEVDGKQHYADGDLASPARYSEMVAEDRRLRLTGYEVYRFGGHELTQNPNSVAMVREFFDKLADRMK